MFGIIADLATSAVSVLFPAFMSYKALRTSDPAQISPWLMYWTVFSLVTVVESYTYFVLSYVPFYSWLRLGLHLWLVVPGQTTQLYQQQVHPFLLRYETDIDEFIGSAHEKLRKAGLDYYKKLVEYVKVNFLGMRPTPPPPPAPAQGRGASYAQQLFSRFTMPAAGQGAPSSGFAMPAMPSSMPAAAGDYLGLLATALQAATVARGGSKPASREAAVRDLTEGGNLIPANIAPAERLSYLSKQREGLQTLLQAFDREAYNLTGNSGEDVAEGSGQPRTPGLMAGLTKSKSEVDFEKIETSEAKVPSVEKPAQSGWMPWSWGAQGSPELKPKQA